MINLQTDNFVYIWQFIVSKNQIELFKQIYGPEGDWVNLFSNTPGYLRTIVLQDEVNPQKFLTLDYWNSREDFEKFKVIYKSEYEELDKLCETLIIREKCLGYFNSLMSLH